MAETLGELETRRGQLLEQLVVLGDFRPGMISVNYRKCGKINCACAQPEHGGHGPQYLWNTTQNNRSRSQVIRLGPELEKVERELANYRRLVSFTGNGYIEPVLELRASVLYDQNAKYLDELKRITPAHTAVIAELNVISEKTNQLDALMESSLSALDTWAESHANLRIAVNTKKPLTVSRLTSKVREIWGIINPEKE